jgi:hypothetical protein
MIAERLGGKPPKAGPAPAAKAAANDSAAAKRQPKGAKS